MSVRASLSVLARVVLGAATASAQVAGTWVVTYDSDIRRDGDKVTVNSRSTGKLTLEQKGDSVFGSYKVDDRPDGVSRRLTGMLKGKTLTLTTGTFRSTVNIIGKPTEMSTRNDSMGIVEATGMRGTMFMQMGDRPAPPRKSEAVADPKR